MEHTPAWPVPPENGWTADDLDLLPELPRHTELIDGSLIFPTPQTLFHDRALSFVERELYLRAPKEYEVLRRFTIDIDHQNRPEPDAVVVREEVLTDWNQTRVPATAVLLAVEVTTSASLSRDRETKPVKYARVGIPHYWRVEDEKGLAVVHVFELDQKTASYNPVGVFRDRMKVSAPFDMDLDLSEIRARRKRTS